jgi:hypothetical protein
MQRCSLFEHVVFLMPQICMALSVTESYSLPTWHGLNATFHSNQSVSAMIVMFVVESEQMDSPGACLCDYYRILRMGHYRMLIPLTSFPVHHSLNTITQSAMLLTVISRCIILMQASTLPNMSQVDSCSVSLSRHIPGIPKIGYSCFLPYPFQFISDQLS